MLLFLSMACAPDDVPSVRLLEGFGFAWQGFNHRLSHLGVVVEDRSLAVAVVGGTSTTGVAPDYGDTCDPSTCTEFPFSDTADVSLSTRVLSDEALVVARDTVTLVVDTSGGNVSVSLPWTAPPESQMPVIAGLVVDSAGNGELCYDPSFGWLPTHLAVAVEADGPNATVSASFTSGLSLEPERACLDEAASEAQLEVTVTVLGIAGVEAASASLEQSAGWNEDGSDYAAQDPPAPVSLDLPDARAFQAMDWRFHVDDPEGRGAYLRTLTSDTSGDVSATNYSPGTQLSGFDYAFSGTIVGFSGTAGDRVEHAFAYTPQLGEDGSVIAAIEAEAD